MQDPHDDIHTFKRLVLAAQQVCALAESGALFAACDGAEPQRTDAVAAFDALEAATAEACITLGVLTPPPAATIGIDPAQPGSDRTLLAGVTVCIDRCCTVTPSQEA